MPSALTFLGFSGKGFVTAEESRLGGDNGVDEGGGKCDGRVRMTLARFASVSFSTLGGEHMRGAKLRRAGHRSQ